MNLMTIIIALIVFGVIVTVHEMGHFFTAKYFGVTVHEFSVGMGPKLYSKTKKETEKRSIIQGFLSKLRASTTAINSILLFVVYLIPFENSFVLLFIANFLAFSIHSANNLSVSPLFFS